MKRKRKTKAFDGSIDLDSIIYYHEKVGIPKARQIKQEETRRISYSRTVRERQITIEDFPYAAGLIIKLKNGHTSIGGATLISRDRLVTAGHCWKDDKDEAKELTVVLGSLTLFKGGTRIKTNKVVLHPYFQNNYNKLRNDIAVIKLDTKLEFTKNIQKVDLPYGSMLKESFVDAKAVIVGYGRQTEDQTIGKGQTLHHKTVQVIDNHRCQAAYLGKSVNERVVCAQSSTGTTCPGDSGSAMTVIRKNKSILASTLVIN
ncbi:collagenase-like [Hyposmocoma kahamanoa]|uniref:collagenase-like n=1 Tax=Hyposmocoma kahamanoa TaxID=1477025 RepID=UPI000E6D79A2|nr:collagenase-like [Hyposmocoma kahamanoa]